MLDPLSAEKTVPEPMATMESRPGTRVIRRSTAEIARAAMFVWNRTSPISTNIGIGVSVNTPMAGTVLRIDWIMPFSAPRKIHAPMALTVKKAIATGSAIPRKRKIRPRSSASARYHSMFDGLQSGGRETAPVSAPSSRRRKPAASAAMPTTKSAISHQSGKLSVLWIIRPLA